MRKMAAERIYASPAFNVAAPVNDAATPAINVAAPALTWLRRLGHGK